MTTDHSTSDVLELQRSHPAPTAITLSSEHRLRLGARIDVAIDRRETRLRVVQAVGAPATVLACALAVVTLVLTALTGTTPDPRPPLLRDVVADPGATRVLERVATVALAEPLLPVRPDQFVYTRSAVLSNEGTLGGDVVLGEVHEREIWLAQDPGPYGWRSDVIRELGQDWPMDYSGPAGAGAVRPTYAWLASLPTEPDALLDVLEAEAYVAERQEPEQAVFQLIGSLINEQVLPPETAAAFYRAVTRIPGVEVQRGVTDALGRRGVGISRTDVAFNTRSTWIFDTSTYQLLGTSDWFTHADGRPDTLFGATAVIERDVVDDAGAVPGSVT